MSRRDFDPPSRRHLLVLGDPCDLTVHDPGTAPDRPLVDTAQPATASGIRHILIDGDDGG